LDSQKYFREVQIYEFIKKRRLVGLKWLSKIEEDGKEVWIYESMPGDYIPNESNQSFFWLT
jgi:hypothetical protein